MKAYGSKRNHKCRVAGHDRIGKHHDIWCDPATEAWRDDVNGKERKKRARRDAKKQIREEL